MTHIGWKWFLPVLQLALAVACHVYEPHEFRVQARLDGTVDNPWYYFQHSPALAGRLEEAINFPALVLNYPLRKKANPIIYERNSAYGYIVIYPGDISFFLWIVLFWYWVGWKLDQRKEPCPGTHLPNWVRIVGLWCGAGFGALTGVYGIWMVAGRWRPYQQIGAAGILWSIALISYFTRQLRTELRASRGLT
jgi:hypothetical protein